MIKILRQFYSRLIPEDFRRQYRWLASPYLRLQLVRRALEDASLRQKAARLRGLKGQWRGQRCFIMGNGPSLNQMDLGRLEGEPVWGLNKCYRLYDRISWRPAFYVAVDARVVPDIAEEISRQVSGQPATRFFLPELFSVQCGIPSFPNLYWYNEIPLRERGGAEGMFSRDAARQVYMVRTVTLAALQLAVYLGFHPIYLIGCDTSYVIPEDVERESPGSDGLTSRRNNDPNHFDAGYFGEGSRWHVPHPEKMIFHYEQARKVCDALGVRVLNATAGGKLEVFPRVDYKDITK